MGSASAPNTASSWSVAIDNLSFLEREGYTALREHLSTLSVRIRPGIVKAMLVPPSLGCVASIVPPWASTRRLAIARPRPVPPVSADRRSGRRRAGAVGVDAGPVSRTSVRTRSSSRTRARGRDLPAVYAGSRSTTGSQHLGQANGVGFQRRRVPTPRARASPSCRSPSARGNGSRPRRGCACPPAPDAVAGRLPQPSRACGGRPAAGPSSAVSSSIARRRSGSAPYRPSSMPSTEPRITCSGVRSSWAMSASSSRRRRSFVSSRSVISLKAAPSRRSCPEATTSMRVRSRPPRHDRPRP